MQRVRAGEVAAGGTRARVGGRWLYRGSENRCSNAPPRDYVHQAGVLSHRVIMRGAIICDGDDEERAVVGIASSSRARWKGGG